MSTFATPKCPGCRATTSCTVEGGNLGAIAEATGWTPIFDCKHGLSAVWVCPSCTAKLTAASTMMREVFGDQLGYMHMGNIARLSAPEGQSR